MPSRPKQLAQEGALLNQVLTWDGTKWAPGDISVLLGALNGEPTGFPNRNDTLLIKIDGTRTFSIQPAAVSFDFYVLGQKFTKNATQSIVWPNNEGIHFFYFDSTGALQTTQTFTDALILANALCAILYWDATNSVAFLFCDERHGIVMDGKTHLHLHVSMGCRWRSGLALQNIVADGTGNNDNEAQFSVEDGYVRDEDLQFYIQDDNPQNLAPIAQIPVIYRTGASGVYRRKAADNFPLIYSGDGSGYVGANGRIPYNQFTGGLWQFIEVAQGDLALVHYFGTNNRDEPVVGIIGQDTYVNLTDARANAPSEIRKLLLDGLPTPEFAPIATVIYQSATTYGNTPHARIRSTLLGENYIDYRFPLNFQV